MSGDLPVRSSRTLKRQVLTVAVHLPPKSEGACPEKLVKLRKSGGSRAGNLFGLAEAKFERQSPMISAFRYGKCSSWTAQSPTLDGRCAHRPQPVEGRLVQAVTHHLGLSIPAMSELDSAVLNFGWKVSASPSAGGGQTCAGSHSPPRPLDSRYVRLRQRSLGLRMEGISALPLRKTCLPARRSRNLTRQSLTISAFRSHRCPSHSANL